MRERRSESEAALSAARTLARLAVREIAPTELGAQQWSALLRFSEERRLLCELAGFLRPFTPATHPEAMQKFEEPLARARERNPLRLAAAIDASRALDGGGVPNLVIGGADYSLRFYGGIDRRACDEVCLIVPPEAIDRAESVFTRLGARRKSAAFLTPSLSRRHVRGFGWSFREVEVGLQWATSEWSAHRVAFAMLYGGHDMLKLRLRGGREARVPVLGRRHAFQLSTLQFFRDAAGGRVNHQALLDVLRILVTVRDEAEGNHESSWQARFASAPTRSLVSIQRGVIALGLELIASDAAHWHPLRAVLARDFPRSDPARALSWLTGSPSRAHRRSARAWALGLQGPDQLRFAAAMAGSLPARLVVHP